MTVTLTEEQYTTLAGWAESYGTAEDMYTTIRELTDLIERANSMTRQFLLVRWRDANAQYQGDLGTDWPPQHQQQLLRFTTPWTYEDVMDAVNAQTTNPVTVEVTSDRTGTVGWYAIDDWFNR